jgi:hypothetical protein
MTAVKRISHGDYKVFTTNCANVAQRTGNIVFTTNNFIVDGNVELTGNLNRVSITNTIIENTINQMNVFDSNIVLNANITTGAAYPGNSGVIVSRGNLSSAALFWNEATASWQITSNTGDVNSYYSIATTATGNLLIRSSDVTEESIRTLVHPSANGNIILFANTTTSTAGGTSIFFKGNAANGSNPVSGELISRRKALVYSIIF